MTVYTWERIRDNWLAGGVVAVDPAAAVEAFNRVAEYFSEDWVEASRVDQHGTIGRGTASTLHVITLGQLLQQLDGVDNTERLLTKLQRRDPSALAELDAIHLVCSGRQGVGLELEPAVQVGSRNRHPDFRVRQSADEWTYVEVTQANVSVTQADVRSQLQRLTSLVSQCEGSFGLEVFLKREATTPEVDETAAEILRAHGQAGQRVVELPAGLGTLYWNTSSPGSIELDDHGESYTPRLGMASAVVGDDHQRHIAVRWPFTDERAVNGQVAVPGGGREKSSLL